MNLAYKQDRFNEPSLLLFIDKNSSHSMRLTRLVRACLRRLVIAEDAMTVCDVRDDINRTIEHRVLATPTLIRTDVSPPARLIGNIEDSDRLFSFLATMA